MPLEIYQDRIECHDERGELLWALHGESIEFPYPSPEMEKFAEEYNRQRDEWLKKMKEEAPC